MVGTIDVESDRVNAFGGRDEALVEVAPGARHAEAWSRRSDKYYVVGSGQVRFVLDGHPRTLKAGDFCFVKQGRRFSYSNESPEAATLVLVHTPSFVLREEVFVDESAEDIR